MKREINHGEGAAELTTKSCIRIDKFFPLAALTALNEGLTVGISRRIPCSVPQRPATSVARRSWALTDRRPQRECEVLSPYRCSSGSTLRNERRSCGRAL